MAVNFRPRPEQAKVLAYRRGKMGVAAVPGSGKTWTLSLLAAQILQENLLAEDQEVLVVTLTNSAVDNFSTRVDKFLAMDGRRPVLVPNYRVRTLHGLAHDIVRENPSLVGLEESFQIIDERAAEAIRRDVAHAWLQANPDVMVEYINPELDDQKRAWVQRDKLPELVEEIALSFIRTAKDLQKTPDLLRLRLDALPFPLPLVEMGYVMYRDYQRALAYRGAVDFDDLIRLALLALDQDKKLLERLQYRWPYILEDEAQDSSALQEMILSKLVGSDGNWVRVGDPNQAIYETFTTASPEYLRSFLNNTYVIKNSLPNSGRSTQSIIWLANNLVAWAMNQHPLEEARSALSAPPYIQPVPPDDEQQNPVDAPEQIYLMTRKYTAAEEVNVIGASLQRWIAENPEKTVAVLAPTNSRAFEVVDELRRRNIEFNDNLLRSSVSTRTTAEALEAVLVYLSDPDSTMHLVKAFTAWRRDVRENPEEALVTSRAREVLRRCRQLEDYLWPRLDKDWLAESSLSETDPEVYAVLVRFRTVAQRWQGTVLLPVDQIVLTLSQDLFSHVTDLAIAHKLAVLLRMANDLNPDWRLGELTQELGVIARNERRFLGFSDDDTGFDPERYKGIVVVATMHKAKGLEWDRVYLMSVNNYDFPTGESYDQYMSEKWFIRGRLNLEAEIRANLSALFLRGGDAPLDPYNWPELGDATQAARIDYIRERLRLFYVGITRAKSDLIVTWNTGRMGNLQAALPFLALVGLWEDYRYDSPG
jgi:DNA helicase II / ATP-dependent DNA helicase PcrA